ncbi:MAG: hypothetical protein SPL72_08675 [Cyanobacteriota bacterium]|nr:hypothetical protein [Cyanobacteriota bacterium]
MNFIKNILFVSYLKNKGIRRICFVVGFCSFFIIMSSFVYNIIKHSLDKDFNIDKVYSDLLEVNEEIYYAYKYKTPYWYRKVDCLGIYLKHYNIEGYIRYEFTNYKNVFDDEKWCNYYQYECNILKAIKDKPIHLKCGVFDNYDTSNVESLSILFAIILLIFYTPFLFICLLKVIWQIFYWIYIGFKESVRKN